MNTIIKQRIEQINVGQVPVGYKKTKVGIMPADWESKLFSDFIIEKNEFSSDTTTNPLFSMTVENGVTAKTERYERSFLVKSEQDSYKVVECGDFVYNPMNITIGAVAVSKIPQRVLVSRYYDIFTVDENHCDRTFYINYLKSGFMKKYFSVVATGSIKEKQRVHFSQLRDFKLPFPRMQEQRNISLVLGKWDDAIDIQERIIRGLIEKKKSLFSSIFSLPCVWEERRLSEVLAFPQLVPVENITDFYLLNVKLHLKGIELTSKVAKVTEKGRKYFIRDAGEILIGRQNFHNGGIAVVPEHSGEYIASDAISTIAPKNNVDPLFLFYFLSNPNFYRKVGHLIGGTGQKEISEKEFLKLKVYFPNDENIQRKTASIFSSLDRIIELEMSKLEKMKLQKKALMQLLLTGIVRVKI